MEENSWRSDNEHSCRWGDYGYCCKYGLVRKKTRPTSPKRTVGLKEAFSKVKPSVKSRVKMRAIKHIDYWLRYASRHGVPIDEILMRLNKETAGMCPCETACVETVEREAVPTR